MVRRGVIKDKKAQTIVESVYRGWYLTYGFSWVRFFAMGESLVIIGWRSLLVK